MESLKEQISKKIAENKIDKAFIQLNEKYSRDSNFVLLYSQWSDYKKQEELGLLPFEDAQI